MFKYSKLILIILICLVTFAIGYALFSGNAKISSSIAVDATDINVNTTCGVINVDDSLNSDYTTNDNYTTSGVENAQINCSGTNVQWSANYLYPGAAQGYWVELTNNSNFDVIIQGIEVSGNENNSAEGQSEIFGGDIYIYDGPKDEIKNILTHKVGLGIFSSKDNSFLGCVYNEEDCVIPKGETYTLTFREDLNEKLKSNSMNYTVNRTLKIGLEQYN